MSESSKEKKVSNESKWIINFDKIEDSTRRNYFSVLPQENKLMEFFSEAFVINKPKGRVGGDGYWLHNHGNDVYLALFTCVGEGHLASMMIRIYMNALKKMVDGYSIDFPGSILQFLHREVQARFKDKNNILLNTNANVGIVKLNTQTKAMEFAGANMDLLQVHRRGIQVIKGEQSQVGETGEHRQSYTSISLENTEDSSFYLCSTGVFNLIGGAEYKKLKVEQLGEFFRERRKTPMTEQRTIAEEHLVSWTGVNRQNDDIMIIGFKA
ncbi:PP2C family protein-serine/threonine phosphatase [Ekhidna sp.]|uniref:PP2C family protein-serine/threonine phosphatase n=1 Tax=Ekhidna sp. TaxID=2608089 RepID=UPI003511688C